MADKALIIKIPEKVYNALIHTEFDANLVVDEMRKSIVQGILLPEVIEKESIPYLMHKEMDIPISECQKAYDVAIEYLRSQGKLRG